MLDVGQGDAFLLRSKGHTVLVDTGNQDTRLVTELAQTRTLALDAVVVTHADDDHCGSLDALENVVRVRQVIVASGMQACEDESCVALCNQAARLGEIVEVAAGDTLTIGSFTCEVMWPVHLEHDGGNEDSICLHVGYDENGDGTSDITALFTGDAEKEQLAEILESHDIGPVDILKVGHHGSRNGMTAEQAHQLDPRIALIGVGAHNRYGHPTDEILDMLAETGSSVYRSDLNGTVTCALDSQGITVTADTLSG